MLNIPDTPTSRILLLANFIEQLGDDLYDQSTYGEPGSDEPKCLCGWINTEFRKSSYTSDYLGAANYLGLANHEMNALFSGAPIEQLQPTAAQAARVLRHLAVTGVVDWNIALEKEPALVS